MNDTIGAVQAASILGLTRQRVWQMAKAGELEVDTWLATGSRRSPLFSAKYISEVAKRRAATGGAHNRKSGAQTAA